MRDTYVRGIACVLVLAGCGGGSSGGSDAGGGVDASGSGAPGTIHASWTIQDIGGAAATCDPGFDTMLVTAVPLSADQNIEIDGVSPFTGMFDCAAGAGDVTVQVGGQLDDEDLSNHYDVTWDETSSDGLTVHASDVRGQLGLKTNLDVSSGDASGSATFFQDGGYIWLEWSLVGETSDQNFETCGAAGVDHVQITLNDQSSGSAVTTFTAVCDGVSGVPGIDIQEQDSVGGTIQPVLAGDFSIVANALAAGSAIGTNSADDATDQVQALNKIDFVDPTTVQITLPGL
jgi:hypothetical protein|nr:hypothetical protein [Kofleriaceae bacterium]